MLFNSLEFLVFFLTTFVLYWSSSHRVQNRLLLVASYIFYATWDWRFLSLILLSTLVDYFSGARISASKTPAVRKAFLALSITTNLGILGFFKYFDFFIDSLTELFAMLGLQTSTKTLGIILPVGISFYTFQTLSYTIDIYRGKMDRCKGLLDFGLFVSFFPQLVAGPIERAKRLIPQIKNRRSLTYACIANGTYLILWGLFKKVVIADNLGITVDEIFSGESDFASNQVFIGTLFFAFQIYCDFSGYTDIARGVAKLLGFNLMLNFNLPYFATNPSDFWHRWHISLSTWLRDYLYVPLGGNRGGELLTYRNLMITMILGGLWHGAAWNFVIWGIYHGLLLAAYRFFSHSNLRVRMQARIGQRFKWLRKWSAIGFMFTLTLYGWLLFRAESWLQIQEMTRSALDLSLNEYLLSSIAKFIFYAWPLLLVQCIQYAKADLRFLLRTNLPVQVASYCLMFFIFIVLGNFDGTSFIYFQF